ncbi:MAG: acyl-CoA thioester hydrolase/BAAT C-terminal domain-containing protein [Mycobacteriales bacterium]
MTGGSRGGEALPYLPNVIPAQLRDLVARRRPVPRSLAFVPVHDGPTALARVSIPAERIDGAVLLMSAGSDGMWPSAAYGQLAADRLAAHDPRFPLEHRAFNGACHGIAGPPGTSITSTTSPGPGVTFEPGGSASATSAVRPPSSAKTPMNGVPLRC